MCIINIGLEVVFSDNVDRHMRFGAFFVWKSQYFLYINFTTQGTHVYYITLEMQLQG